MQWVRRIRAVFVMGLIWAAYGVALAGVIELVDNVAPAAHPFTRLIDMWPQTLAMLGFARGVVFAIVLGLARGRRRFEELSYAQFAAWGAVAGVVLATPALIGGAGIAYFLISTLLSALAGAGSLALARLAERRGLLGPGASARGAELTGGVAQPQLGAARESLHVDPAARRVEERR